MKHALYLFFLLLFSKVGVASDWHFNPYFGFDGQYTFIKAGKEEFNPITGRFRLGSYIYKTVGLEATYSIPLHTDTKFNVDVSMENSYSLNFRWESPPENHQGLSAYILTGYVVNDLQIEDVRGFPGKETYKGFNLGVGFKQKYYNVFGFYVEYNYQYYKDDLRISGISMGGQFEF